MINIFTGLDETISNLIVKVDEGDIRAHVVWRGGPVDEVKISLKEGEYIYFQGKELHYIYGKVHKVQWIGPGITKFLFPSVASTDNKDRYVMVIDGAQYKIYYGEVE